ncbi:division/cell wall cluster transcriptional repressor MraZ [Rhodopila sp.]|uniref:division/cell wall cluster transcriptional repressor MraZ n=1 Tax=Rhodopila sp. TaxID=2480087 RepID=UPI003D0C9A7E
MAFFIGTHQNKLDSKGRVSIPAHFRSILKKMSHAGETAPIATIYLRPSHQYPCIEGWTEFGFEALSAPVEQGYDLFSSEHDDLVVALFADACVTETDKEGRIMLPANLVAHAGLTENVTFMGTRNTFQIWEPAAAVLRQAEARENTKAAGFSVRAPATVPAPPANGPTTSAASS